MILREWLAFKVVLKRPPIGLKKDNALKCDLCYWFHRRPRATQASSSKRIYDHKQADSRSGDTSLLSGEVLKSSDVST